MVRSDFSLPFSITSDDVSWYKGGEHIDKAVYQVLPISGLLRIEEQTLCFQFRRSTPGFSVAPGENPITAMTEWVTGERKQSKPDIEEVCVPLDQIREGTLKRARWFTSRLTLHANDLRAFEEVPGGMGIRIVMRIAKEHLDLAESFVSRLHVKLSEHTIRDLDNDLD